MRPEEVVKLRKLGVVGMALVALAGLLLVACGGGSSSSSGKEGGSMTILTPSFTDFEDPQLGYEATGWEARYNVYIPLLTYAHAEGAAGTKVIPGLAESLPKITDAGKTYTLTLRKGLKYSNGKPVKVSDVKFAIQRIFKTNSKGIPLYTNIVGAEDFEAGKANDISGIVPNDKTGEIVFHLVTPYDAFDFELALQFAAPVPPDTPLKYDPSNPIPSTGPYMFTDITPGQSWTQERNPFWDKNNAKILPDLPGGHLDKITSKVVTNYSSATTDVEQNTADDLTDPPPTDRLGEVQSRYADRFKKQPTVSTYYFYMNTQAPPFNDLKVRQAVNYALDPEALVRIYGGLQEPTQQVIPPTMKGYQKIELYPHNMAKAKQLMKEANPSDKDITLWTDTDTPNDKAGEYMQSVLKDLGFNVKLKIINGSVYFDVIGNQKTADNDIGWNDWFEDFPHPNDFFDPLINGENIAKVGNLNTGLYDNKAVNKRINELAAKPLDAATEKQYAALDKQVMQDAPWAPFGTRSLSTFTSDRVNFDNLIWSPVFQDDYSSFQLTK
jgi:peptide/nickel transport system substrate-binding protein